MPDEIMALSEKADADFDNHRSHGWRSLWPV